MKRYFVLMSRKFNITKMFILSKAVKMFSAIPIKISIALFTEQRILKFVRKHKKPKSNLKKE